MRTHDKLEQEMLAVFLERYGQLPFANLTRSPPLHDKGNTCLDWPRGRRFTRKRYP